MGMMVKQTFSLHNAIIVLSKTQSFLKTKPMKTSQGHQTLTKELYYMHYNSVVEGLNSKGGGHNPEFPTKSILSAALAWWH